jgi:hypothetical protein
VTVQGRKRETMGDPLDMVGNLSDTQRVILSFIRAKGEVAPRDIRELFPDRAERSIQRDIKGMIEAELVESTGGSRSLRYRLKDR